jgi:hypothetical protein
MGASLAGGDASAMTEKRFRALDEIVEQIDRATALTPDAIKAVADAVKHAIAIEADATKLCGVLIEAIAMTVWRRVPEEKQASLSSDILKLMYARFDSLNILQPPADEA